LRNEDTYTRPVTGMGGDGLHGRLRVRAGMGLEVTGTGGDGFLAHGYGRGWVWK